MTRDYSQFFPGSSATPARRDPTALEALGWQPFFAQQLDADDIARTPPVRVTEVHRSGLTVRGDGIEATLPPDSAVTVGDWLLHDAERPGASRRLERKSLIRRRAAGREARVQLIAANIDTAFLVTSCNADFNVARLERYIALALEAGVEPVILLTKADLAEDAGAYLSEAAAVSPEVPALALDARGAAAGATLAPWNRPGRTLAFLGSSGVGKSTLTNALLGTGAMTTQGIREDDAKGRHTTTHRQLFSLPRGAAVLDTPGMRELQLADAAAGLSNLFADIDDLAASCRFRDCAHDSEPGCAVQAAIATGVLDPERLHRYRKLAAEDALNSATIHERREKERAFSKHVKRSLKDKPNRR